MLHGAIRKTKNYDFFEKILDRLIISYIWVFQAIDCMRNDITHHFGSAGHACCVALTAKLFTVLNYLFCFCLAALFTLFNARKLWRIAASLLISWKKISALVF